MATPPVLVISDSIMKGTDNHIFTVSLHPGCTISRMEHKLAMNSLKSFDFDSFKHIVFMVGSNDLVSNDQSLDMFQFQLLNLCDRIKTKKSVKQTISFMSVLPKISLHGSLLGPNCIVRKANYIIKMTCKSFNFHYIDVFKKFVFNNNVLGNLYQPDGVHVSEDGKRMLVDYVRGVLLCVQLKADR